MICKATRPTFSRGGFYPTLRLDLSHGRLLHWPVSVDCVGKASLGLLELPRLLLGGIVR